MNVLVIGSGGREHALVKAIARSPLAETVYCLPGNPGMEEAVRLPGDPMDIAQTVRTALERRVGLCVVAPEDPLDQGLVDALEAAGVPCFGPTRAAARIESSKAFAKELMSKAGIPTARYRVFDSLDEAAAYVRTQPFPLVVKADGLAKGKGVVVAESLAEAVGALEDMLSGRAFGLSGTRVVIEEALTGPEVSLLCLTDGETVVPLLSAMDHKRALDGDQGPNTGGMGAVAPSPLFGEAETRQAVEEILLPAVRAMREAGCPFSGCLFAGLMLTPEGPRVLEFNARFGDPETQAVLPLMESDLLGHLLACREGRLKGETVRFMSGSSCCLVFVSGGYPEAFETGFPVRVEPRGAEVCFAGIGERDGELVTAGGRVLSLTAVGDTLGEAVRKAYYSADQQAFFGQRCRRDIGRRALEKGEKA